MTMNWERKQSWPDRGIGLIPAFTWGVEKNRETAQSG